MSFQQEYEKSRVCFLGSTGCRLQGRLFSLFAALLGEHTAKEEVLPDLTDTAGVSFDIERRAYLLDGEVLTQRHMRLVLFTWWPTASQKALTIVISPPEREYPKEGGARITLRMGDEGLVARLYHGCRQFAKENVHFPQYPSVPVAKRELFRQSMANADQETRAILEQVWAQEDAARAAQDKELNALLHDPVRIAVLDTEMAEKRVIQFSGLLLEQRQPGRFAIKERRNCYLQLPPKVHISSTVFGITHISEGFLARKGLARGYALEKEIRPFLKAADYVCGHAVYNDVGAIREEFGDALTGALDEDTMLVDTQVMADLVYDLDKGPALEDACELAGVAQTQDGAYHDAMYDTQMTAKLLLKLFYPFLRRFGVSPARRLGEFRKWKKAALLSPIGELSGEMMEE